MMTEDRKSKIVNFIASDVGVLKLRCGHISSLVKIHYFFKSPLLYFLAQIRQTMCVIIINKKGSTLIVNSIDCFCIKRFNAAFFCHCWFIFMIWLACWCKNMSPFEQEINEESLKLVTSCWLKLKKNII